MKSSHQVKSWLLLFVSLIMITGIISCEGLEESVIQNDQNSSSSNNTTAQDPPLEINTGLSSQTFTFEQTEREYLIYIPTNYTSSTSHPMMLNFHENGGTHSSLYELSGLQSVANEHSVVLIYPQGATGGSGTTEWNAYVGANNKSSTDDFGFIDALITELIASYSIDSSRIYALGYSNGGMMAYALACYKSDLIAAVGSVSGTMMTNTIQNCNPSHPTGIINIHGTYDYILPYDGGYYGYASIQDVINYWISANHTESIPTTANIEPNIETYMYENGDQNVSIAHYKINQGYHSWLTLNINGLSTSEILWNYLSQYSTNGRLEME